jgi:hypothetical protein
MSMVQVPSLLPLFLSLSSNTALSCVVVFYVKVIEKGRRKRSSWIPIGEEEEADRRRDRTEDKVEQETLVSVYTLRLRASERRKAK